MSKIGRRPISVGNTKVEVKGQAVHYAGKKATGVYDLTSSFKAKLEGSNLHIEPAHADASAMDERERNRLWGMHRAILANKVKGASQEFEKQLLINGLGFKAAVSGSNVVFSLGFSHKIDFNLPKEVTLEVDKTGQKLIFRSADRELLGAVCSKIRDLRPPEPYKGTGIKYAEEVIARKAGKTKA